MSDVQQPSPPPASASAGPPAAPPSVAGQPKAEEIPLEDLEKLLNEADPGLNESLEAVRQVETDKTVVIESTVSDVIPGEDEKPGAEGEAVEKRLSRIQRIKTWLGEVRRRAVQRLKQALLTFAKNSLIFLKTRPKEFVLYFFALLKAAYKKGKIPLRAFREASRIQRLMVLLLFLLIFGSVWILLANIKGIWIPAINEPILKSFESEADFVDSYDRTQEGESFYTAFPQERYEFQFKPMKVNLRRVQANSNPMGAFELVVLLDSKDTAIEAHDREVEFFDLLERVLEDETFADLETELGKAKLKSRLKRELNQKLTQGWVKDINFKTFVLKP